MTGQPVDSPIPVQMDPPSLSGPAISPWGAVPAGSISRRRWAAAEDRPPYRPRVLQVGKFYAPYRGGIERVVQELAEGLSDQYDVRVLVCQPKGYGESTSVNGIEVVRAGSLGMVLSMPLSPSFPYLLNRLGRQAALVHVHMPFPLAALGWLGMRGSRPKLVVTYHSDIVRQRRLEPLYGPVLRRFLDGADRILVGSPNMMQHSVWLRPHLHKCEVVPFFVDLEKIDRLMALAGNGPDPAAGSDERPVILFVGRMVYYKGLEYLLRAMPYVDARLVLVGDGPLRPHLEALADQLRIRGRVTFVGQVTDSDLAAYYRRCSCLVLPSVEPAEAFGLVQLEAMAFGKPVVNTALPTGVPFVSVDGETGITVPPRDVGALVRALRAITGDPSLQQRYGRNARARVEKLFSKERVLRRVSEIYSELLGA